MINMIKSEMYRLTKTKGFYLYWTFIILTYLVSVIAKSEGGVSLGVPVDVNNLAKLDIRQVSCNFTYYYLFLLPVFGLITADFGSKTIKNTISSAISRKKYFVSKFIITETYLIGTYLISNYAFYGVNRIVNGEEYSSTVGDFSKAVFYQTPFMAGVAALLILAAFLLRKIATFNAVTMISPLAYSSIAVSIYQLVSEKFAADYLLKYEIATVLSRVVLIEDSEYLRNCTMIGFTAVVGAFIIGYVSFSKYEIN